MTSPSALRAVQETVETRLGMILPPATAPHRLHEAMRYAVLGGGKRLRPAMAMAASVAAGGAPEDALDAGCAVELVHCFSLVHDDLPALDDDDLRRGRPTVHRAFDEATAILAGDALFALAFETLAGLPEAVAARCLGLLSRATGSDGLVGGEVMDLESEGQEVTLETVETIHRRKTGRLIAAACAVGGACAGGSPATIETLRLFGETIGLAFQIVDDVLNETSTAEELGKAAGSDRERAKATFPAVIGVEASRARAEALATEADRLLAGLPGDPGPLRDLARMCVDRRA